MACSSQKAQELGKSFPTSINLFPSLIPSSWSTHAITRTPSLFGPDEDCFRPERWILTTDGGDCGDAALLQKLEQNNDMVFGYGRFKCLGQAVALVELNKVFVELLRRFEFTICDAKRPLEVDWQIGIWVQRGMWVRIMRRE